MSESRLFRYVGEEGKTEDLIRKARTGDLIEVCTFQCASDATTIGQMAIEWKPCRNGVIQAVSGEGFWLNGRKIFTHTEEFVDWFPYRDGEIIVMSSDKLTRLFHDEEKVERSEVIHQHGQVSACYPHIFTESLIVDDRNFGPLLVKQFVKNFTPIDRARLVASKAWAAATKRSFGDIKALGQYWNKKFATQHVQSIVMPLNPGTYSLNDSRGVICLVEGRKFIRVFPDMEEQEIFQASQDWHRRKWIACSGKILNLEETRIYFNEDTENPLYVGKYDDVYMAGTSCLIRKRAELFLPFDRTHPVTTVEMDDTAQHPSGLMFRRGTTCYLLIVKQK